MRRRIRASAPCSPIIGDRDGARHHFGKGFRGHAISSLPYRGTAPPVTLLQLVSSGGGNIPTASFLDDRVFLTSVIVTDYLDPATPLPPHQLIFNAIGDADLCQPALEAAARLIARTQRAGHQRSPRGDEDRPHRQCKAACAPCRAW